MANKTVTFRPKQFHVVCECKQFSGNNLKFYQFPMGENQLNMSHNDGGSAAKQRFKKKSKKKRFIANAKGFGKKGIYGRGTHIEEGQFTYFVNILDTLKSDTDLEDKVTMANNVFDQTVGQEIHLSSNQIVCKAIENLISFTDVEHFDRYMQALGENLRPICSDKYASHVLQKIVEIAFLRSVGFKAKMEEETEGPATKKKKVNIPSEKEFNTTTEFSKKHRENCSKFVLKMGKFLLNNLEDFVWDPYASHIMRTTVLSLAGIYTNKVAFQHGSDKIQYDKPLEVSSEWTEVVQEYVTRLQLWPQFNEFPYNELSSALLASLCVALNAIDKSLLKHFGKKILNEAFLKVDEADDKKKIEVDDDKNAEGEGKEKETKPKLPKVFYSGAAIRLLETLLSTAGKKLFTQLNAMLFTSKTAALAKDRSTNFAVQKLLEHVREKSEFEEIFEELSKSLEDILLNGHTGVVSALSAACLRISTKQASFVSSLQAALHCVGTKEKTDGFLQCVLKFKPYEVAIEDKSQFIHLHGSLVVQHMLQFNKPIKLVQCLMEISAHDLATIFNTPNGSFIADAFVDSKFIGEKSRDKLVRHMEGSYLDMAITKFGSRVVEKLFEVATDGQKPRIIKELAEKSNQLNGTLFGRVLFTKFRVATYQLSPAQWKAAFDRANKAENLFKDIVN